jgi:hypothetical protein
MDDNEESKLHDEADRERFAVRNAEVESEASLREMERRLADFEDRETQTKKRIEDEWRREHFGHDPERPPAWQEKPEDV